MDAPTPSPSQPNPNLPSMRPAPEAMSSPASAELPKQPEVPSAAELASSSPPPPAHVPAAQPVVDPMALAMAQPSPPVPVPVQPDPLATPMPNLAADVDVIEPEWVNKAEDVVRQHLGDPYGEEEAVEELQEAYLKQRYGFTVHEPDEDTTKTDSV